ncbi:Protein of unknown function DUF2276 [Ignisphaera aggregans DSM 17230]|uniref:CRISPR-associated protein Cas6 C-terminal domain-containing protein n=1 Tax=Ignisphaera aggregans (strain DSM 17230 / JCM 13409 / AQ1.S1) TaxID=583356 RepID=E0STW9_IGNAA|nr:Protein of unknown function DUF2276 [Ignisphaera aggregans DSM 17230]
MLYTARVYFTPMKLIPLAVWSGMYLYRELLNLFEAYGARFEHRNRKPFYLSPIFSDDGKFITSGMLEPDKIYMFRFSTIDSMLIDIFRTALGNNMNNNPIFRIVRIEESVFNSPILGQRDVDGKYMARIELKFAPTVFKYRGLEILYPSPTRFFLSIARDLYDIFNVNLRKDTINIIMNTEIASQKINIVKIYIGKSSNNAERHIKTFSGKATYVVLLHGERVPILNIFLRLAEMVGVGKNRSIGLGHVDILSIDVKKLK